MELYQIRYFLAVCDTLNFTRAAERCHVSQPALTKAVQKLEDILGGRLFDRTRNAVQLTELGRALLPHLQQIYAAANQTREHARRFVLEQREPLRTGVMCTIDFNLVLPGFLAFQQAHPNTDVQFREGSLEDLTDALDKGHIDLGVMCSPHEFARRFSGPVLFREDFVVACAPGHRLTRLPEVRLEDLHRERYCERTLCEFSSHIDKVLVERGVDLVVVQQTPREDWIQSLVRAGFGIAYMPESTAVAAGLPYVKTTDCAFVREVRALALSERPLSEALGQLLQALPAHDWSAQSRAVRPAAQSAA